MELRVIKYFLAIAREGSITKAANHLNITQPTLSRQIKDLEYELGHDLFIRRSHDMILTTEGMHFRKRAEEIIELVNKSTAEFTLSNGELCGDIYIGSGETDALKLVGKVATDIHKSYPNINYHFHSGNYEDVTERLDKGLLDFGILIEPADISKYDYLELPAKDTWGVVMKKDSPLAKKKYIERKDLLKLPLICSQQVINKSKNNSYIDWFGTDYDKLNIISTYNLIYNASIMVDSGLGYAITIDKIANTSKESSLCFRPLKPTLESGLNLVWKKYQIFSPVADYFLNRLRQYFNSIEGN